MKGVIATLALLLCNAASQAAITCYGEYDSFSWWTGNKLNSSQKLTGGDNMQWNAYMVTGAVSRIQYNPTSWFHVTTPPADHHWGYYFQRFSETRVGWYMTSLSGLPAFWSVNDYSPPWEDCNECFYGFDTGSLSQPYVFDPVYMTPGLEGAYYGKWFTQN